MEAILGLLKPILESMSGQNGMLLQVLVIMASFRVVFKPLMALASAVVEVTPPKGDDELLAKIKANKYYKMVVFLVDYFASIKLPK